MVHRTKGIVLRTVKYGETSIIVSIYTELFGIQSYIINGVRKTSRKGSGQANLFHPPAILELEVYHNELKNLQRIREFKWSVIYQNIFSDVKKNIVALFMVELLQKCLKQPESQPELFYFIEDAFKYLDEAGEKITANFPLYFFMHLAVFFGLRIEDNYSKTANILDLKEGSFTSDHPLHDHYLEGNLAEITSTLLKIMQPAELEQLKLNQAARWQLLEAFQDFYIFHMPDFSKLKSLPVLHEVLS